MKKKESSIKRGMKSKTRIRRAVSSELSFGKTPTYIARVVRPQPLEDERENNWEKRAPEGRPEVA